MKHPETHQVTPENGPRPAGQADECFYCKQKIGADHKPDCVCRKKTVVVRLELEIAIAVPEDWDTRDIEFFYGEKWCASNLVHLLEHFKGRDRCLCPYLAGATYLRDATEEEEADFNTLAP